jgi:3-oxoacyl-[acyl-carrier-protein] synthase-1
MAVLVEHVLDEMREKLAPHLDAPMDVHLLLGVPESRPGFGAEQQLDLRRALARADAARGATMLRVLVKLVPEGHAAAAIGLSRASAAVAAGERSLWLVGGVDSYLDADAIEWLEGDKRLMGVDVRGGFPPGEGAALLALASEGMCRRLRLPSLATLASVALATESAEQDSDEGLQGKALGDVYARAGAALSQGELFEELVIDINDERCRTTDFGFALLRAGAYFRDGNRYVTSVGQTGELGAASAAFNCVLATRALVRQYARGPNALVSSASWGGLRGGVFLRRA